MRSFPGRSCLVLVSSLLAQSAIADTVAMPSDLIGSWGLGGSASCTFKVSTAGYSSLSDSEGYNCKADRVEVVPDQGYIKLWRIHYVCEGEFGTAATTDLIAYLKLGDTASMSISSILDETFQTNANIDPLAVYQKCD